MERGFFPEEVLRTYDCLDSCLQGHPDVKAPGVDVPSGSLGQGLSVGLGLALGARLKNKDLRVYVMMGDGELQEGQVWEAAMSAPFFKLDNVTAIVDCNSVQFMGPVEEIMSIEPLADKWKAFNWNVIEIDGHDVAQIADACEQRRADQGQADRHHRPHRQGQGRVVHGEQGLLAFRGGHRRGAREGLSRARRGGGVTWSR